MPYILNLTTGSELTIVKDGTVDNTTSLTFIGRNFAGYGEPLEENFVRLLENFSSPGSGNVPSNSILQKPLQGQLWFNSTKRQLYVSPDGLNFKGVGSITVGSTSTVSSPVDGDMFWDNGVLYAYQASGSIYVNVGPADGNQFSSWKYGRTLSASDNFLYPTITGIIGTAPMITFSNIEFSDLSETKEDIDYLKLIATNDVIWDEIVKIPSWASRSTATSYYGTVSLQEG
jgi:hypothetical protein